MAEYFQIPEVGTKVRPGSYFNVDKNGDDDSFGAIDGVVVAVFKATFGPVDKVTVLERGDDYTTIYGDGLTTDLIREVLYGGAKKVICCRLNGTGGAVASVSLTAATGKVKITAKHPGEMPFSVTIRNRLTDKDRKECIIYTGTTEFEKVYFSAGDDEAASLVSAFANSKNFTANLEESAKGIMTNVNQTAFTGGKNPTVATANYSAAFSQAEKYFFNTICVDTEDTAVHALLQAFLDRIYETSQFGIGVVAEKDNKDLDERMNAAAGFDGENIVYVLNPKVFINEGTLDGYQTAGLIAGLIAATPANQAVTHMVITRYVDLAEPLTNTQIIKAELKGCLVLSKSTEDEVWIDAGINTLINLPDNKDKGWKKIRRVRTRYELLYRANAQSDALVGKVDPDKNGKATIIGKIQGIINAMIKEKKLTAGTVTESTTYIADADDCYFDLDIIDKDSAEHIYSFYKFRFSTNAE